MLALIQLIGGSCLELESTMVGRIHDNDISWSSVTVSRYSHFSPRPAPLNQSYSGAELSERLACSVFDSED